MANRARVNSGMGEHRISRAHCHQGMALIMLIFIIGLAATAYLAHAMSQANIQAERDKKTAAALAEAKAALIGYATSYSSYPGALPCPDIDNDGKADKTGSNCEADIGRLPWSDLGLSVIRDGDQECLWYVLSKVFRNAVGVNSRGSSQPILNSSTNGTLSLYGSAGNVTQSNVIAIIFSPGSTLSNQNRTPVGSTQCGGNNDAAAYLDQYGAINNANGQNNGSGSTSFVSAVKTSYFNDKLIAISHTDLFKPVVKVVLSAVKGNASNGLVDYYGDNLRYPYADNNNDGYENLLGTSGILPIEELTFDSATKKWLSKNQWAAQIVYSVTLTGSSVIATLDGQQVSLP